MALSQTQSKLWKIADAKLAEIGGRPNRNPDKAIRERSKTEGTFEWALMESTCLASPAWADKMTDQYCAELLSIIEAA